MLAAIVIEVCFALIAAWMVVTLVQSYIVIAAGVINMAFGGSRWTKDIAVCDRPLHCLGRRKADDAPAPRQHRAEHHHQLGKPVHRPDQAPPC